MFLSPRSVVISLVTLALAAVPARAQRATDPIPASAPAAAGPRVEATIVAARPAALAHRADEEALAPMRRRAQFSRSETLMIIGGAAFVAGALIGDDAGTVVMVGGAAVGLYGLYLYLQQ